MKGTHGACGGTKHAERIEVRRADDGAVVIHVARPAPAPTPCDELVAFPFGLEARTAKALVRRGDLKAARLGRRLYCKRSDLLALVDKLASEQAETSEKPDDYAALVDRTKRRAGAR